MRQLPRWLPPSVCNSSIAKTLHSASRCHCNGPSLRTEYRPGWKKQTKQIQDEQTSGPKCALCCYPPPQSPQIAARRKLSRRFRQQKNPAFYRVLMESGGVLMPPSIGPVGLEPTTYGLENDSGFRQKTLFFLEKRGFSRRITLGKA